MATSGDDRYDCPNCSKSFTQKRYLRVHMGVHTGERPHTCSLCKKAFLYKCNLKLHMTLKHSDVTPHKCSHCDKSFRREYQLLDHMSTHDVSAYKCHICVRVFKKNYALKKHLKTHTNQYSPPSYQLALCGRSDSESKLPFACGICKQSFIGSRCTSTHMETQNAPESSKCYSVNIQQFIKWDRNHSLPNLHLQKVLFCINITQWLRFIGSRFKSTYMESQNTFESSKYNWVNILTWQFIKWDRNHSLHSLHLAETIMYQYNTERNI